MKDIDLFFENPLVLLAAIPLVLFVAAAFRLLRREKDPGEKHIHNRRDPDPWDRPDRKL